MKEFVRWLGVALVMCCGTLTGTAHMQNSLGAICVTVFEDSNANGIREFEENALAGVNVNLSTGDAIIATHITTESNTPHCFENLLRGEYTVVFTDAPTYDLTTPRKGTFTLDSGQRLTIDPVGAVVVPVSQVRTNVLAQAESVQSESEPLDTPTRLLLATVGSVMVMLGLISLGSVVWLLLNRKLRVRPPKKITPPDH